MVSTTQSTTVREGLREKLPDFLIAECTHVAEALVRNEESGERRATFFVTLAGAVGGGFALAFGGETPLIKPGYAPAAASVCAAVLLLLGIMTTRRILEQRIVTDRHIFALRDLRRQFVTKAAAAEMPNAFFKLYDPAEPRSFKVLGIGKGGWFESVAFVNAVLAGVVVGGAMLRWNSDVFWQIGAAVALALVWIAQVKYARRLTAEKFKELNEKDIRARSERLDRSDEEARGSY